MLYYDINGNPLGSWLDFSYTDAACIAAFVGYMAQKCTLYGMTGTYYANPSGLTTESYTTPRDMLKLGVAVSAVPLALSIWGTDDRSFAIKGDHARTLSVENNVIAGVGATLNSAGYKFLGGKGGSYWNSSNYWRAGVDIVDIEGRAVILSLLAKGQTNYNNLHLSTKELCDMVKASLDGQTPTAGTNLTALIAGGGGYAACLAPSTPGAYANLETPTELLARDHSICDAATISSLPASTSKTMTMLCALDYIGDLHEPVFVKIADITSGSGSTFYDGDQLTVFDALRIMMMESSNTLANTIARTIGRKILSYGE
jgi:hypothetical protein